MKWIAVDTETTGLSTFAGARPFLIGIGDTKEVLCYEADEFHLAKEMLEDSEVGKVFHNAKFDMHMLRSVGIKVNGPIWCTMIASHLINENTKNSLEYNSETFCPEYAKDSAELDQWFKENKILKKDRKYEDVPRDIMHRYLIADVKATYALREIFLPMITKMNMLELFELEMKTVRIVLDMEQRGHLVDIPYLHGLKGAFDKSIKKKVIELKLLLPDGLNFNSNIQLARFLIEEGAELPLTEKGNPQVNDDALKGCGHPVAQKILELRYEQKQLKTYVKNLIEKADEYETIHTNFTQTRCVTGRFSAAEPNLQNLPKSDKTIRRAFIPREGYTNFYIDYSQMEYRVFMDYAQDRKIQGMIRDGLDAHQYTADKLGITRDQAKTVVFGLLYGMGVTLLSNELDVSMSEAKRIKSEFFAEFESVEKFMKKAADQIVGSYLRNVKKRGYVFNKFKRRRNLDKKTSYKAVNAIIQGGCADVMRRTMVRVHELLEPTLSSILLQVHDELVIEIANGEEFLVKEIKEIFEDNGDIFKGVELKAGVEWSRTNWSEKKEWTGELPKEVVNPSEAVALAEELLENGVPVSFEEEDDLDWL